MYVCCKKYSVLKVINIGGKVNKFLGKKCKGAEKQMRKEYLKDLDG
jgi:hypothetical protein